MTSIMQTLHDSEINCGISCFYDGQWNWQLGDDMNGITDEGSELTLADAEKKLSEAAVARYPASKFAQAHGINPDA